MTTVGSFCTGIAGLDMAVERHFGGAVAWYSEVEPAPCVVLEREMPGVPNLGDLTTLDWSEVEPVDIITAGYPCQPFSHAGKRKGSSDVRHLWPFIAEAVRVLRPRFVVLENVAGHLTLGFDRVLGDLAEAGFDAEWCLLRASDVGAPHRRERLFVVATDTRSAGAGRDAGAVPRAAEEGRRADPDVRLAGDGDSTPADAAHLGHERGGSARRRGTGPADGGVDAADPSAQPAGRRHLPAGGGEPASHTDSSGGEARHQRPGTGDTGRLQPLDGGWSDWGEYAPAIHRWEAALRRPAPRPVDDAGRLSPAFVEWMMGYPRGWVNGLNRTAALKALGNAVVTQQATAALMELAA